MNDHNMNRGKYREKKQWLLRYSELMREIERESETARFWRDKANLLSGPRFEITGVKSTHKEGTADYIVKFLDLANECERLANDAEKSKDEIVSAINELENPDHRQVLTMRYIDGLEFIEIAQELGYSLDWVWRLHRAALKKVNCPVTSQLDNDII